MLKVSFEHQPCSCCNIFVNWYVHAPCGMFTPE